MFDNPFHRSIYLTGATANGKTAVGVALAQRIDGEVLALDSMTLYRGMDIGTAKPTRSERGGVPHHLIDLLDPWDSASVAQYIAWAREKVLEIESRGKHPIFVGGTALYLKALLRGLFKAPSSDPATRRELESEAKEIGSAALHKRLSTLDPVIAGRLHPNDERRIVRALEVIHLTGQPMSSLQTEHDCAAPPGVPVFALVRPREDSCNRINHRVESMFAQGLVEEVRDLYFSPKSLSSVTAQAVGYKEVIDLLEGRETLESTISKVQTRTRQFAKRQGTWFRGLTEVRPVPITDESVDQVVDRLVEMLGPVAQN